MSKVSPATRGAFRAELGLFPRCRNQDGRCDLSEGRKTIQMVRCFMLALGRGRAERSAGFCLIGQVPAVLRSEGSHGLVDLDHVDRV